ncbi:hypothetical protein GWK47_045667 [Chionoecetes opilio]|uniref:Uncharacterized protein n=1 Tax=Chionoecetes opilio TaxID=41210 RepID=A0A8J5CXH5_CHIOP|nr:hypothetical protein GWK47_045667 [Chionoecetes opilio]
MLGRKLFWNICGCTQTSALCHLPPASTGLPIIDTWLHGPVCHLLSSVNEISYNAEFRGVPGDAHHRPSRSSTVDQLAWTDWQRETEHPGNPSQVLPAGCTPTLLRHQGYHRLEDGPSHIRTQLRSERSQPRRSNSCNVLRADRACSHT